MQRRRRQPVRGFTLTEVLVAIGIIALMVSLLVVVVGNLITGAKEDATSATILKVQKLVDQRVEGFDRRLQGTTFDRVFRKQFDEGIDNIMKLLQSKGVYGISPDAVKILVRKDFFKNNFPQRFAELPQVDGDNDGIPDAIDAQPSVQNTTHDPTTESSELLYWILTQKDAFGVAAVDEDQFTSSEVMDTDGDGLLEFVDAWGRPLRFYRWPTRLIKPWGAEGPDGDITTLPDNHQKDRATAGLLIQGLPAAPAGGERDELDQDPDDPTGRLSREVGRLASLSQTFSDSSFFEATYHTIDTWHRPLIVSAGPDGELGLFEPRELDVARKIYGTLAQPVPNKTDALTDNLTNRNQRAGGN